LDLRKKIFFNRVPSSREETSFFWNSNIRLAEEGMYRSNERLSTKDDDHLLKSMPRSFALIYSSLDAFYDRRVHATMTQRGDGQRKGEKKEKKKGTMGKNYAMKK